MKTIESLFDELLLPLTKHRDELKKSVKQVPENKLIYDNSPVNDTTYLVQTVRPQSSAHPLFNFTTLLSHIPSFPQLSEESKIVLNRLSDRLNACKRVMIDANVEEPVTEVLFENTFSYLYYIGELLPLFANNKTAFVYRLPGNEELPVIQHTSLVFEYLVTLWGIVSHMFRHLALDDAKEASVYSNYVAKLDICIHILREMVAYISKVVKHQLTNYRRFVYRPSPTSISNSNSVPQLSNEELEALQHEKDITLIESFFGGIRGITARLHLFYAKKYELSVTRALHSIGITDILGREEERAKDILILVNKENAGHMLAISGVALQISNHYSIACKKIKDETLGAYHYTYQRSIYWRCVAFFLRAAVDFFQYEQREDRVEYGKQALKRMETIKSTLESFNYDYSRERPQLVKAMSYLTQRMTIFFEIVNQRVKVLNHRNTDGVVLAEIEETIEDESKTESIFSSEMTRKHQILCEKEVSQCVKQSLALLYKLKQHGENKQKGGGVKEPTIVIDYQRDTVEDMIKMAVLYERYNWLDYEVKNITVDTNGDSVVILRDVERLMASHGEAKRKIQENLLKDPTNATSSSLSNKLSSHLYI